jgi:riboflavin synthase
MNMFTGLVEETGTVQKTLRKSGVLELEISARKVLDDLNIDDSININGVCQTIVRRSASTFTVQAVQETLRKTTLGSLKKGNRVNLERALLSSSRLGGHFVQGHIDGTGVVKSVSKQKGNWQLKIEIPTSFKKYIIPAGSICIDGVSLTVASIMNTSITIAIIPHTLELTTLRDLRPGETVNIELDMIGKYIVRLQELSGTEH